MYVCSCFGFASGLFAGLLCLHGFVGVDCFVNLVLIVAYLICLFFVVL